jgi:hypothetical protein
MKHVANAIGGEALGATGRNVVRMILRDGLAIAVPGVLIGAPCAGLPRGSYERSFTASLPVILKHW